VSHRAGLNGVKKRLPSCGLRIKFCMNLSSLIVRYLSCPSYPPSFDYPDKSQKQIYIFKQHGKTKFRTKTSEIKIMLNNVFLLIFTAVKFGHRDEKKGE
jgi:hypothetical protein